VEAQPLLNRLSTCLEPALSFAGCNVSDCHVKQHFADFLSQNDILGDVMRKTRRDLLLVVAALSTTGIARMQAAPADPPVRPFMVEASHYNIERLLESWRWLVPTSETPLLVSGMGDIVCGRPDGSIAQLDILEGNYKAIAQSAVEFNTLKSSEAWLNKHFSAEWFVIARNRGLVPAIQECLGWKVAPIIGGKFAFDNLAVFDMDVYQSLQGQLHRQIRGPATTK
jgi:hypothetical protein